MQTFKAEKAAGCQAVRKRDDSVSILPLIRNDQGRETIWCVSPGHGRSFLLRRTDEFKWIIGKGNGLSYTSYPYLATSKQWGDTWGGLPLENAVRDYDIGMEASSLGIRTNCMESVVALDRTILKGGQECQAALLQYSVECPYRINNYGFMPKGMLREYLERWGRIDGLYHLYAAEVVIRNLQLLHDHHVMHNAMHPQNYTWALELLDFEVSRSDRRPYDNAAYENYVPVLMEAEAVQMYEIINYIAWCLGERADWSQIERIYGKYGFDLKALAIKQERQQATVGQVPQNLP